MTRIRRLGAEFHHPDDFVTGARFFMTYLVDLDAYQQYLDDDISILFTRETQQPSEGQTVSLADNATGYSIYRLAGLKSIWRVNHFKAVSRYTVASVFERNPVPISGSPEVLEAWGKVRRNVIEQCRRAVEWHCAKGRGALVVEDQVGSKGVVPIFRAVDPAGYIPILHPRHRDQVIGHALGEWWRSSDGGATPPEEGRTETERIETDIANRLSFSIIVSQEQADNSDGWITRPVSEDRTFQWAGQNVGVLGSLYDTKKSRIKKLWTFGIDDSVFGSMESNVFEALMHLSNARTSMTRDVRTLRLVPAIVDNANKDERGRFIVDRLEPDLYIPTEQITSGTGFGYVEPPGPNLSMAFMHLYKMAMMNLAYTSDTPPEAWGDEYKSGEPADALHQLRQTFLTKVQDIRDDLVPILSEAFEILTGHSVIMGWESPPFARPEQQDERAIKLKAAGLISVSTGQQMTGVPVEEIQAPMPEGGMMEGQDGEREEPGNDDGAKNP